MPTQKIRRSYRKTRYILYKETLIDYKEHFWSFLGSFVGIGILAYLESSHFSGSDVVYLIGSFGASSVLIYGIIQSPFSQPRNLVGGHVISAFIGVTINKLVPDIVWISAPLAVSLSIIFMQITKTLHPPGGATALIAVTGSTQIKALGYMYVISPVLVGVLILLLTALVFNNLTSSRSYPSHSTYHKHYHKIRKRLTGR
ncbi:MULTISPECIES: HPP family protein [unclassified Flavobacterium]|jgi:CBS domain-containing membrane protein|uniref:HPP family protein n=1 Tax=unclassified Flavobacterium TaxID=196869 RepID=UPI00070ED865|nr:MULTISPECIES: HPP family protein [unclassified Flavobacterium]KRD61804.1 HPP family protein [Flavobacterium sp. Root935]MDQ1167043.1 CBS domain-containing membrane protein [Flavobacterium sp. SORGH_AS_0622]TDX12315.1 HPP family protein [Flavobacterium sp. S87F.05.LMB.W.Kidney.N]BDU27503.1 membrane protein [Flavobacterium sp. GSB-24]